MMRNALLLAGLILLLLGCASTPESFALIPEPEPLHIPPSLGTRSGQCTPDQPIVTPGQTVMDDAADVLAAHVDIIEVSSSLSEETLTVVFQLRDVPETLTFGRTGVPENAIEYNWEVAIDVDNDWATGSGGFDYVLSAMHFVFPRSGGTNTIAPIATTEIVQTYTWELDRWDAMTVEVARIEVAAEDDTITLSGKVPGITAESRLAFGAFDYLGGTEEVGCYSSYGFGYPPIRQCMPDEAPVRPGDAVADDVSDVPAAHIDITGVNSSLSGETLTVVFQLRDVPETLTFDRTGVPDEALEYRWKVSVDADNDRETGFGGVDYFLSASHIVPPSSSGSSTTASVATGGNVEVNTRKMTPEGFVLLEKAHIEASVEDNTITLSGKIPGITAESPLAFEAYDYFGGKEKVGCLPPAPVGIYTSQCDSDEAMIAPNQTVIAGISDTLPAHMDIIEVSTTLTGETLSVVFHLRDLPETLEFNREGVPDDMMEYNWEVSIDVDNDAETGGFVGDDYTMSASRFVHPSSSGETVHLPLSKGVQANAWQVDAGGGTYLSSVRIELSSEENTITLIGNIPGITPQSRLAFQAYDFLQGSEQIACHGSVSPGDTG